MEPRRLAAGQLGPLCIHALNRRSGRRPFPRPPFSRESDRLEVRGWRDGGPGGADGPRAATARTPARTPAPRRGASTRTARTARRCGTRSFGPPKAAAGRAGFHLPPDRLSLNYKSNNVQQVPQPSTWLLSRHLCASPEADLAPAKSTSKAAPPRMLWWSRGGEGKKKKEQGSSIF